MARLSDEELAAWVAASCRRHDVPVKVADALAVADVVVLLSGGTVRPPAKRGRAGARSQPPDEIHPGGVERLGGRAAGADHDAVEEDPDDGVLTGEVESTPLSA